jgi:hypothetical protein
MRWLLVIATGLVLLLVAWVNAATWAGYDPSSWLGVDFRLFREFGSRWLETGSMYLPSQSAPYSVWWTYDVATTPSLYPPLMGPLFGLLALIPTPLAAALWWGVPVAVVVWVLARWRPAPWTWPLMALCFLHPMSPIAFLVGSSTMWAMALVALGLIYRWPAALLLLKPTLLPFALIGVRDRRWWIVAGVVAVTTIASPYLTVVANGTDSGGFLYSLPQYPLLLLPVVAWLGRSRVRDRTGIAAIVRPVDGGGPGREAVAAR